VKVFRQFYKDNKDKLFGYILRRTGDYQLAADTMQESFTRCLERYDKKEPSVALLFTIGRNLLADNARKQKMTVPFDEELHARAHTPDPSLIREDSQLLLKAMAQLDQEDADILALVTSSDLSYKEISRISGISEANIKTKVHRTRLKLKKILSAGEL